MYAWDSKPWDSKLDKLIQVADIKDITRFCIAIYVINSVYIRMSECFVILDELACTRQRDAKQPSL